MKYRRFNCSWGKLACMSSSMLCVSQFIPMLTIGVFLYGMVVAEALAEDKVTVQLNWYHQAQFAGFYAADQLGYYSAEGLRVDLLPRPAPNADTVTPVKDGTVDFGLTSGVILLSARSQGHLVSAIAAIYRRSPQIFITLASSCITRPHDFPGHTMRAMPPGISSVVYRAMMTRLDLDPDSVRQIETGYDMTPFFVGEVDIWPAFLTNEVLTAHEQNYPINEILPDDYGVHQYGDTLFTTEKLIQEDPDLVLRFLRATLKGWRWAIENPEKAALLTLKYDPALDKVHEVAMMEASVPLIHTGEDQIGWMRAKIWQQTHDILLEQGILEKPIDVNKVYTLKFLQKIYGEPQ